MSEETSMLELLNERLEKEDIVKLVCDYDNKFNKLEENNNQLKSQLQQKDKEIERLNNIINELENYIRARVDDDNTCSICSVMIDDLLNIL